MARQAKRRKEDETEGIEKTVDPYTGELVPVAEDADEFIEVVPEETDDRRGSNYILNEETGMDRYAADADAVAEQSAHYTEDADIREDFAKRQQLANGGREMLLEELEEHNSLSPRISGGDIDAAWQDANVAGDEAVGGSVSTPDQDRVDELGEGAGLTYRDDEPLDYDRKVVGRDRERWELNPASADGQEEEPENELDDEPNGELDDDELEDDEDELEEDEDFEQDELDELLELDEEEEDEDLDELDQLDEDEDELIDLEDEEDDDK